ncbi:cytochrome P450 [Kitasatospora cinereorecta]|uniref:Cytochrome P450 n=1 Tax=Kitasatospora cinereorecta TaxID=285560 RepID=A0ABW0VKY3_9ACTN
MICDLLGVPEADRVDFRSWTDTLLSPDPGAPARSREAMRAMLGFLADLTARKRRAPADDLLSDLIAATGDGRLAEHELLAMLFLLLFAGYHNSAALVSSTVLALLTHPHQLAAVRTARLDLADVTEEVLRWDSPAMPAVRRFPTEDMRLADRGLGAGDRVWLSWAAANRDPSVFPDPDVFDPTRAGPRHACSRRAGRKSSYWTYLGLRPVRRECVPGVATGRRLPDAAPAFGRGPHHCVGAALARLENEVAVEALLHRFPRLALAAEPGALGRRRSLRSGALTALPVTV